MGNVTINRVNKTVKEQDLIQKMNENLPKTTEVKEPVKKNPVQVVKNSEDYLIDKMNTNLNQPRDSKGRFASNKDQGTQMRPQVEEPEPEKRQLSTFDSLCYDLMQLHAKKNADYGNSWLKHLKKYGLRPFTMRVTEKVDRIDSFIDNGKFMVKGESIQDTLLDIAAYAIMTAAELIDDKDGEIMKHTK